MLHSALSFCSLGRYPKRERLGRRGRAGSGSCRRPLLPSTGSHPSAPVALRWCPSHLGRWCSQPFTVRCKNVRDLLFFGFLLVHFSFVPFLLALLTFKRGPPERTILNPTPTVSLTGHAVNNCWLHPLIDTWGCLCWRPHLSDGCWCLPGPCLSGRGKWRRPRPLL